LVIKFELAQAEAQPTPAPALALARVVLARQRSDAIGVKP